MSNNPGTAIQGEVALTTANIQEALSRLALPALGTATNSALSDLGVVGQEPASIRSAFAKARLTTEGDFAAAQNRATSQIAQEAKQSGVQYSQEALGEATRQATDSVDLARASTLRGLNFEEANSGLAQTNFLLSSLIRSGGAASSGALGFGQSAIGAGQILSQLSQQGQSQGATYGALAGTVIGALLSPYTGGASIPAGAAAGTAIGGWLGGG